MNLNCISRLEFNDNSNALKDKFNTYESYYSYYGSIPSVGGGNVL